MRIYSLFSNLLHLHLRSLISQPFTTTFTLANYLVWGSTVHISQHGSFFLFFGHGGRSTLVPSAVRCAPKFCSAHASSNGNSVFGPPSPGVPGRVGPRSICIVSAARHSYLDGHWFPRLVKPHTDTATASVLLFLHSNASHIQITYVATQALTRHRRPGCEPTVSSCR